MTKFVGFLQINLIARFSRWPNAKSAEGQAGRMQQAYRSRKKSHLKIYWQGYLFSCHFHSERLFLLSIYLYRMQPEFSIDFVQPDLRRHSPGIAHGFRSNLIYYIVFVSSWGRITSVIYPFTGRRDFEHDLDAVCTFLRADLRLAKPFPPEQTFKHKYVLPLTAQYTDSRLKCAQPIS